MRGIIYNLESFKKLSEVHDLVICTDSLEDIQATREVKIKKVLCIDNDIISKNEKEFLLSWPEGKKILQWQKLSFALLKMHECLNNYDSIVRIRADLNFDFNFVNEIIANGPLSSKVIKMHSDYVFEFRPEAAYMFIDFYRLIPYKYYNNYNYSKIPILQFTISDREAAKFCWLKLPADKISPEQISRYASLENYLNNNSHDFLNSNTSSATSFRKGWKKIKFPSEVAFIEHILKSYYFAKSFNSKPDILHFLKINSLDTPIIYLLSSTYIATEILALKLSYGMINKVFKSLFAVLPCLTLIEISSILCNHSKDNIKLFKIKENLIYKSLLEGNDKYSFQGVFDLEYYQRAFQKAEEDNLHLKLKLKDIIKQKSIDLS